MKSIDYDDNDDDELFLWYCWPTKSVSLVFSRDLVRDPHHHVCPTRSEQDLNLGIT